MARNVYEPLQPPVSNEQTQWALKEFNRLADLLNGSVPRLVLAPQAVVPTRPREGTTVNADGTNWNPGGGAGLYQYLSGAWVKL